MCEMQNESTNLEQIKATIGQIDGLIEHIKTELEKFVEKNNESAGVRVRKLAQHLKNSAQELRQTVHKERLARKEKKNTQ